MACPLNDLQDAELLVLVGRPPDRDTLAAATSELVTRYQKIVYGQAMLIAGYDSHLADDVFQDTFVRLFKWFATRPRDAPLHSFPRLLATFAKRAAIDYVRKRRGEPFDETLIESASRDLTDACYARELMSELDDRSRGILHLAFFEGLDTVEIAAQLGLKTGYVRVLKHRAIRCLRDRYQADDALDSPDSL